MVKIYNLCTDLVDFAYIDLPPRDQRHQYLRFEGLQNIDADIADFEMRLGKIYIREVHRVRLFDFGGLIDLMAERLSDRMLMEHRDAQGHGVFTSRAWRRLFDFRGSLVSQYGIFQFMDMAYWSPVQRPRSKEIDKVGEVSVIWNPVCVVVMLNSSYLGLRKKYRLSLKYDIPPRDK
ncbi:hypothetical protein Tco_0134411 [Tanacetum coccineum]